MQATDDPLLVISMMALLFYLFFFPLTLYLTENIRNIYSNHLHFLSYLLKCPVDKAGNSFSESLNLKLFWGVRPHADPPTLERLRPSNFFPLRTPSKSHATSLKSITRISKTSLSRRFLEAIFQVRHYQPETFIVQI